MPRRNARTDRDGTVVVGPGYRLHMRAPDPLGPALPPESEKHWQAQVLEVAKTFGWGAYHTWNSRHSASGFPDLVLVRPPRLVFAELKTNRGLVSDDQQAWIDALLACGQEAYVWRPADLEHMAKVLGR